MQCHRLLATFSSGGLGGVAGTATASRWLIPLSGVEMVELKHDHVFHSKVRHLGRRREVDFFLGCWGVFVLGEREPAAAAAVGGRKRICA